MKAPAFAYARAASLAEACALLAEHGEDAKLLAGGQSLVPTLNMRLAAPKLLVDINDIPGLDGIKVQDDVVRIGALTRHRTVERSDTIARHLPLLTHAMPFIAHPAVRNRGTLGGSLALADPAAELPGCAVALGAAIIAMSARGERRIPASAFFVDLYETALAADEMIVAVEFPRRSLDERYAFLELARRHGDYATVGICAAGHFVDGRWRDLTLVFLGADRAPRLATSAVGVLTSAPFSEALLGDAKVVLAEDIDPIADLYTSAPTKRHLAGVLLGRALAAMSGAQA